MSRVVLIHWNAAEALERLARINAVGYVREFGLKAGWVDYKICSVDETWSGLLFGLRRSKRVQSE